jgi:hypothetical protein
MRAGDFIGLFKKSNNYSTFATGHQSGYVLSSGISQELVEYPIIFFGALNEGCLQ